MDNAGDWLNIVIMVIAGIIGLLNSGKKKRRTATTQNTPQQEADIDEMSDEEEEEEEETVSPQKGIWEILEEIKEEKNNSQKPAVSIKQPEPPTTPPAYTFNDNLSAPTKPTQPIKAVDETAEEPGIMPETTFSNKEELRKAIICAEILHRKY